MIALLGTVVRALANAGRYFFFLIEPKLPFFKHESKQTIAFSKNNKKQTAPAALTIPRCGAANSEGTVD